MMMMMMIIMMILLLIIIIITICVSSMFLIVIMFKLPRNGIGITLISHVRKDLCKVCKLLYLFGETLQQEHKRNKHYKNK